MPSLASQMAAFGLMVVTGLVLGILYDAYRVVRSLARPGSTGTVVMDIVFWVAATPATFLLLLVGNWGELRLYVFLGIALGVFAYFQVASPLVLWGFTTWLGWIGRLISVCLFALVKLIEIPVHFWRSQQVRLWGRRLPPRIGWYRPKLKWMPVWPFSRK